MKRILYLIASFALLAGFSSCDKKGTEIDFDNLTLDGFYVYGEATGVADKVLPVNAMSAGFNEVTKAVRTGMYEKYIYLEGGKEFALIENQAGAKTFYGANLTEVNYGLGPEDNPGKNFEDNPDMMILQGELIIGEDAPALKVAESGLYHIVLDNNAEKDLKNAQIIIHKADFGIRGGCNGWGFTTGEAVRDAATGVITYTWTDLDFSANGTFKFASCHGWKINLDEDGIVKAEVSLAQTDGKLTINGDNIVIGEKAGLYTVVLTYTPKNGGLADSFAYNVTLTKESELPTACYLIGEAIKGWVFPGDAVAMISAHSEPGAFWAIRYLEANKSFKFSEIDTEWGKDFYQLTTNEGYVISETNCQVAESGLYMIEVDFKNSIINVHKAEVFGMGDAFGGWDEEKYPFEVADKTLTVTTTAEGKLRMYAKSVLEAATGNWWHREFNIYDGKIEYRATGDDQAAVVVTTGQTVTLDFNAGTGSIK